MKRMALWLCFMIMMLAAGCTNTTPNDQNSLKTSAPASTIQGVVYGVDGDIIRVTQNRDNSGIRLIHVNTAEANTEGEFAQVGAIVEITTDIIAESYPEQCTAQAVKVVQTAEQSGGALGMAYYTVFEDLYSIDTALQEGTYLALDMGGSKAGDAAKSVMMAQIQQFCLDNGYTLLLDDMDGLTREGYIKDMFFEEGFLIEFQDESLEDGKLVTQARKWRSGLAAIGAKYTVTRQQDSWHLEKENEWIS